jgi:hypothetical protein
MIFSLEATNAAAGDGLLLHYGTDDARKLMLIDGGPTSNYRERLRPRLEALRDDLAPGGSLPLELVMVSHIDDDHIAGVLDLVNECVESVQASEDPLCQIKRIWHNSFGGLLGDAAVKEAEEVDTASIEPGQGAAVVASVGQGAELYDASVNLSAKLNAGHELVSAPVDDVLKLELDDIVFTVVAPAQAQLDNLRELWAKDLAKAKKRKDRDAAISAYLDNTVPNLSSIVVHVEHGGKTMLLTGDARGDLVIQGLKAAGLLDDKGEIEVDLLKVPHHGSDRNVATDFFRKVRAPHYVVSADGKHGNPENATLLMIKEARGDDTDYAIHMTNRDGKEGLGDRLTKLIDKQEKAGHPLPIDFRADDQPSLWVDLLDRVPR